MNFKMLFNLITMYIKERDKENREQIRKLTIEELLKCYNNRNYTIEDLEYLRNENGIKFNLCNNYNKKTPSSIKYFPAISIYRINIDGMILEISSK